MTQIFNGKDFSRNIDEKTKEDAKKFSKANGRNPKLAILSTISSPDQESYIRSKSKKASLLGVDTDIMRIPNDMKEVQIIDQINNLNQLKDIDGIILESPLRSDLNQFELSATINPKKDVDSQNPFNEGLLFMNRGSVFPATASAIKAIIETLNLEQGSEILIVNRSNIIGRPLSMMLLNSNYTVTICHSKTGNLHNLIGSAKTVVTAIGKYNHFSKKDFIEGVNIVDAAINFKDGKMSGDCDLTSLLDYANFITPVPGGVGPVTTSMLFSNLMRLLENQSIV